MMSKRRFIEYERVILLIVLSILLSSSVYYLVYAQESYPINENGILTYDTTISLKEAKGLEAGQIIQTKGYYAQNDGAGGRYNIRKRKDSDIENGGTIIFLTGDIVAELITNGVVSIRQFGAKGDGFSDDTVAVANAITCGKNVYIPKGHYLINKALTTNQDLTMYGDGNDSVLDWRGSVLTGHAFNIMGCFTQIAGIQDANRNESVVTFASDHGLKPGDIFCIANPSEYSWSPRRRYYRAGEMCEVAAVSGLKVRLSRPLYDSYESKDIRVYKMTSRKVNLHDFKVQGTTSFQLLHVYGCKNPALKNISAYNTEGGYASLVLQKCYGARATNLDIYLKGTDSNDHGLSISNCQHALIEGGNFYGRRHAIAVGGTGGKEGWSVINRDVRIFKATLDSVDQYSADMHGCTEDVTYDSCMILNGADFSGTNNSYINCEIHSRQNGVCMYGAEVLGGPMRIENCSFKITNNPSLVKRGVVDFGGNSNAITEKVKRDLTIIIKNCSFDFQNVNAQDSAIIQLVNRGATKKINFDISGITLLNTKQRHVLLSVAKKDKSIRDNSDYIKVNNIRGLSKNSRILDCVGGYLSNTFIQIQN